MKRHVETLTAAIVAIAFGLLVAAAYSTDRGDDSGDDDDSGWVWMVSAREFAPDWYATEDAPEGLVTMN